MIEVELNKESIEQMVEYLLDQAERPIADLILEDDEILKDAARKYLLILNFEEKKLIKLKMNIKKLQEIKRQIDKIYNTKEEVLAARETNTLYQEYNSKINEIKNQIEIQQAIRNIYSAGLAFQDMVNKAIGQDPVVVVTASAHKQVASYKVPLRQVLDPDNTVIEIGSRGEISLRFRTSFKQLEEKANDSLNSISKIESKITNPEEFEALNKTYLTVLKRFDTFKGINEKGKEVGIILWKKEVWKKSFPSSAGDITEAFNNYYLNGGSDFGIMGNDLNNNIDIFMKMVEQVDNAAGRVIGDISIQQDNYSIEYAIKAVNASLQSYNQIKTLANIVLGKTTMIKRQKLSKGDVRTRLKQLRNIDENTKAFRNHIYELTKEDVIKFTGKTLDDEFLKSGLNII